MTIAEIERLRVLKIGILVRLRLLIGALLQWNRRGGGSHLRGALLLLPRMVALIARLAVLSILTVRPVLSPLIARSLFPELKAIGIRVNCQLVLPFPIFFRDQGVTSRNQILYVHAVFPRITAWEATLPRRVTALSNFGEICRKRMMSPALSSVFIPF